MTYDERFGTIGQFLHNHWFGFVITVTFVWSVFVGACFADQNAFIRITIAILTLVLFIIPLLGHIKYRVFKDGYDYRIWR